MLLLPTPDQARAFLGLCLDPGPGRHTRTLTDLISIMQPWLQDQIDGHAPHLAALRADVDRLRAQTEAAEAAYATALGEWIAGPGEELPT